MTIADALKDDIEKGNITGLRIMMKDSLLIDRTFNEFNEMERLTRDVPGLYDEHDGEKFITNKTQWNDDYMNTLMVDVLYNFSHERVEHLKEVVRYLRPVKNAAPKKSPAPSGAGHADAPRQHHAEHSGAPEQNRSQRQANERRNPPKTQYQQRKERDEKAGVISRESKIIVSTAAGAVIGGAVGCLICGGISAPGLIIGAAAGAVICGGAAAVITKGE